MTVVRRVAPEVGSARMRLRSALGCFATGVTVVAAGGSAPSAMTANSFTSVSLDPPLVLVCVRVDAVFHASMEQSGAYSVNVLSSSQQDIARHFADPARHLAGGEFSRGTWLPGAHTGVPLLEEAHAWLECALDRIYDGGDHSIFVGQVLGFAADPSQQPLLFYGGGYRDLADHQPLGQH
jgi:flavin reductase (DIM6/NTAB) family NADH-FMN oxidoreductase RutF